MRITTLSKVFVTGAVFALVLSGCTTVNPYTGEQQTSKTAVGGIGGAIGGALFGAAIGGGRGAAIGALAGGALGSVIGNTMDRQDQDLRRALLGTGVQVRRTRDGVQLVMSSDVVFANNSANIKSSLYPTLDSVGLVLRKYNNTNIVVSGFTSNTGTPEYNQSLSERRAASVGAYLESQGIDPHRIFTQGYGERYPIASNATAQGSALNRRVVITLRQMSVQ
jgi:outer membrane protein OmpA-like peptidoglycan-associated protein